MTLTIVLDAIAVIGVMSFLASVVWVVIWVLTDTYQDDYDDPKWPTQVDHEDPNPHWF